MAVEILEKSRFVGGSISTCYCEKKNEKDIVYIALYKDNSLMVGDVDAIDKTLTVLQGNELTLKIVEELQDYLSCKV